MFYHILKLQREVFWQFCGQAFAAYPLEEIDSIDVHTGHIRTTNALSVVAFGVRTAPNRSVRFDFEGSEGQERASNIAVFIASLRRRCILHVHLSLVLNFPKLLRAIVKGVLCGNKHWL